MENVSRFYAYRSPEEKNETGLENLFSRSCLADQYYRLNPEKTQFVGSEALNVYTSFCMNASHLADIQCLVNFEERGDFHACYCY